jgi:hypothetical protein
MGLTDGLESIAVKMVAVDGVLINLPVSCVDNVAVFAPQDHAAAVRDGMRHPNRLAPAQQKQS